MAIETQLQNDILYVVRQHSTTELGVCRHNCSSLLIFILIRFLPTKRRLHMRAYVGSRDYVGSRIHSFAKKSPSVSPCLIWLDV